MTPAQIKQKVLQYKDWEWWAERPFGAFMLSLWKDGQTRAYLRKVGVDVQWPAMLFQKGAWYKSEKVWDEFASELVLYLHGGGSVFQIVKFCESYGKLQKQKIKKLINAKLGAVEKIKRLYHILTQDVSYIWLAHGFEHIYQKQLNRYVPKYIKSDKDKFIGDASYPKKPNAHNFL